MTTQLPFPVDPVAAAEMLWRAWSREQISALVERLVVEMVRTAPPPPAISPEQYIDKGERATVGYIRRCMTISDRVTNAMIKNFVARNYPDAFDQVMARVDQRCREGITLKRKVDDQK